METNNDLQINSKLQEYFVTGLQEIYWSETNLVNVLTRMMGAATTAELKKAFGLHINETKEQVSMLEKVFGLLELPPQAEPCIGLQGLFEEGWQLIDESEEGSFQRDAALIIAAQKVEHYEIASYGGLVAFAKTLGHNQVAAILYTILIVEKETDQILSRIAETRINEEASQEVL